MEEEMILVVRRALFDSLGAFQGFSADVDRYLPSLLDRENNFFVARSLAETDPSLKQIIPYALIVSAGQILRYRRGKSSGEQRLVAKYSIGIGGHMNDQDEGLFALDHQAYLAGVQREIVEDVLQLVACGATDTPMNRITCGGVIERLNRARLDHRLAQIAQIVLKSYADAEGA